MAVVICSSNYLVQFPFNYFQLNEIITWGAFTYPVSFFITELANRFFGKKFARKVVFAGVQIPSCPPIVTGKQIGRAHV